MGTIKLSPSDWEDVKEEELWAELSSELSWAAGSSSRRALAKISYYAALERMTNSLNAQRP